MNCDESDSDIILNEEMNIRLELTPKVKKKLSSPHTKSKFSSFQSELNMTQIRPLVGWLKS